MYAVRIGNAYTRGAYNDVLSSRVLFTLHVPNHLVKWNGSDHFFRALSYRFRVA